MKAASNQNDTMIPAAEARNCCLILPFSSLGASIIVLNFMPRTGNTHGIILRIKPPNKANRTIPIRDWPAIVTCPAITGVENSNACSDVMTVKFNVLSINSISPNQLLALNTAIKLSADSSTVCSLNAVSKSPSINNVGVSPQ